MVEKLDLKDRKILEELDWNARQSTAQIARKVKLSKDAVGYRIKNLEKQRIILGYYSVLNIAKIGYVTYKFMLTFQNTTSGIEKEIVEYLKNATVVGWLVSCDGPYNLMAVTWVKNVIVFDQFFTEFLKKYSDYIKERDVIVITENHACRKVYLFDKKERDMPDIYYCGEPEFDLDDVELKIMKLLANDSRAKLEKIASKVGLSGEAVAYRIRQLQKRDIIQAFRPIINTPLLGYEYYNVLFRLKRFENIRKMFNFFKEHSNIIYFVRYLGSYDMGIDLEVRNAGELREVLEQIKDIFNEDIESYDTVLIYQEHKLSYLPEAVKG